MNHPASWEQLMLAARRNVHAENLPANRDLPNDVTVESLQPGWTAQQPYAHATCPVPLACVLCGQWLDQRNFGVHVCAVAVAVQTVR